MGSLCNKSVSLNDISSNYFPPKGYAILQHPLDPIARILLIGVYDDNHPLSVFRGMRYIVKEIWQLAIQFNLHYYKPYIQIGQNAFFPSQHYNEWTQHLHRTAFVPIVHYIPCNKNHIQSEQITFPPPLHKNININMMPLQVGTRYINDELYRQIPKELSGYINIISACIQHNNNLHDTICYLTIHESFVKKNKTQRRPGIHIESPGAESKKAEDEVNGECVSSSYSWGGTQYLRDGIYMASNMSDTCAVWNCMIIDEGKDCIIGDLGSMEHLRSILPKKKRIVLDGNTLYWMTDKTPHECLPMKRDGWRQFFRLVCGTLSVWYEDHSTKNPIGIMPDVNITTIIKGNKFDKKM